MSTPKISEIRKYFEYDSGNLIRKVGYKNRPDLVGKTFGGVTGGGYIQGWFKGGLRYLHHLIWEYHLGEVPNGLYIDHIDGDKLNNSIDNLRLVTPQQNTFNTTPQKGRSSVHKGVSWDKRRGKWRARIVVDAQEIYLGRFDTEELAHEAYTIAAKEYQGDYRRK